jgi:hypothetical protein
MSAVPEAGRKARARLSKMGVNGTPPQKRGGSGVFFTPAGRPLMALARRRRLLLTSLEFQPGNRSSSEFGRRAPKPAAKPFEIINPAR